MRNNALDLESSEHGIIQDKFLSREKKPHV